MNRATGVITGAAPPSTHPTPEAACTADVASEGLPPVSAEDTATKNTTSEDTTAEDTAAEDTTAEDTTATGGTAATHKRRLSRANSLWASDKKQRGCGRFL